MLLRPLQLYRTPEMHAIEARTEEDPPALTQVAPDDGLHWYDNAVTLR